MDSIYMYRVELNHVTQYGTLGHSEFRVMNEVTRITKTEGTCGVGTWGKDTGSQHLAITQQARPHNEGLYSVIGKVIKGQDIVRSAERYDMIYKSSVEPDNSQY
jgi:peptidyl-prolyl cis-trans isomerase B (cyclophilin B)